MVAVEMEEAEMAEEETAVEEMEVVEMAEEETAVMLPVTLEMGELLQNVFP